MTSLLILLSIPVGVCIAGIVISKGGITWKEAALQLVLMCAILGGSFFMGRWMSIQDTEIWNGTIAVKNAGTHGCCHSYDCLCYESCSTDSAGTRSCSEICQTCYEHSHDLFWNAVTDNGEVVYSDRCNKPGSNPPAEWIGIAIGEPTAVEHRYTNYIKAAPGTLGQCKKLQQKYWALLPDYPKVQNWRLVDRFLFPGIQTPTRQVYWNQLLMRLNSKLGHTKQVNIIVVVTREESREYFQALEARWLGGKKNDLILVVSAPDYPKMQWAQVMSWMDPDGSGEAGGIFERLPRKVMDLGQFDGEKVVALLNREVSTGFKRKAMADFEYLMKGAILILIALMIISLKASQDGKTEDPRQLLQVGDVSIQRGMDGAFPKASFRLRQRSIQTGDGHGASSRLQAAGGGQTPFPDLSLQREKMGRCALFCFQGGFRP